MKKLFLIAFLLFNVLWVLACPVCERNQPKVLRGITHGAGPDSRWDYVIVWATVAIVLCTLFFSIKWLIRPGERSDRHIKRFILNNE
ncbi:MAG: hypothetical protein E6Q24_21130 [Chitinophagaceae bacterium]|jgi:hypothetical protein|nr:MAG: hypothetical protein E6Q24_21130 [Chitinophagaceae bacterium]